MFVYKTLSLILFLVELWCNDDIYTLYEYWSYFPATSNFSTNLFHCFQRSCPGLPDIMAEAKGNASKALAQALQEKVYLILFYFKKYIFSHIFLFLPLPSPAFLLVCVVCFSCVCVCVLLLPHVSNLVRLQHCCFYHSRKKDIYWREMWMQLFKGKWRNSRETYYR